VKSDKTSPMQYAALPWRREARVEIMLVTSRETYRWVIPKGWPMRGLSGALSAAREAFEEAGIEGEIDSRAIGAYPYVKRMKDGEMRPLTVEVFPFLVRTELEEWPEKDERQRRWFTVQEAAFAVDEYELSQLILRFSPD
jgi:8-oxo-dGTP pyrophosphatase MutT (NUDIX family)